MRPLKLAILHYHLGRGGVTQVICNQLRGMAHLAAGRRPREVLVLHGGRADGWPSEPAESWAPGLAIRLATVPGLDYDNGGNADPAELAARIAAALAERGFDREATCLHIHNHALGKNLSLPSAVVRLAADGWALALQPHDFAEDYRPENLSRLIVGLGATSPRELDRVLYPQSARIHYVTLTDRDASNLAALGVPAARRHVLPNGVLAPPAAPPAGAAGAADIGRRIRRAWRLPADARVALYPVRGIRRKNLGEMLLWAAVAADAPAAVAMTLPPQTPAEVASYRRWQKLAAGLRLPVRFEVGLLEGVSLADNYAAADFVISTSVAEGFGMTFIESWLAGRMLAGRDLPGVTEDFRRLGLRFPLLQDRLEVPLPREERARVEEEVARRYRAAVAFLPEAFSRRLRDAPPALGDAETVDFGRLPAGWQREVICRIRGGQIPAEAILQRNPALRRAWQEAPADWQRTIDANAARVAEAFDQAALAARLVSIYQSALGGRDGPPEPPDRPGELLARLLDPAAFFPLRTEAP